MTLVDQPQLESATSGTVRSVPTQRTPVSSRTTTRPRDRYLDCLRAAALARVVIYHIFGWVWLPVLFPSMPIMFALAGSLVAASLDRSPARPWRVLAKRTRRLLPPLWLMGLIVVPIMMWHGWTHNAVAGSPLQWRTLLLWIFPVSDPPGSTWGDDFVVPLWYIRAYLWFLLLSPAFLWMFRHWPKRVLAVPLVSLALGAVGILTFSGRSGDVLLSMSIFGACWMLGFAHHDNTLRAIPLHKIVPLALALLGAGLAWALTHQDPQTHWDIDNIPLAEALYGLGAVLLLLRFYPTFGWLAQHRTLDKLTTVANSRAMTIYLWNNVAIFCTTLVAGAWGVTAALDDGGIAGRLQQFALTWILIAGAIVLFGWVEDLAAARRIQINPWPRKPRPAPGRTRSHRIPARTTPAVRPAHLIIGTAGLVGIATVISMLTLHDTHTPGRTAVTDAVPNTPAHPRILQPRPTNLAQPDEVPPIRPPHQQPVPSAAPPTTGTAPDPPLTPGPNPASGFTPTNSRPDAAPVGPQSARSPAPPNEPTDQTTQAPNPITLAGRAPTLGASPARRTSVTPTPPVASATPNPPRNPAPGTSAPPVASATPSPPRNPTPGTSAPPVASATPSPPRNPTPGTSTPPVTSATPSPPRRPAPGTSAPGTSAPGTSTPPVTSATPSPPRSPAPGTSAPGIPAPPATTVPPTTPATR